MKTLILLSILALAFSQGFLRNLQDTTDPAVTDPTVTDPNAPTDTTVPAGNDTLPGDNNTNGTNETLPVDNGTNNSNASLGVISPVDITGTWNVIATNCTLGAGAAAVCSPTYVISANASGLNMVTVVLTYPQSTDCGELAGQSVTINEIANAGVWFDMDNTTTTVLTGSIAAYNQLNQSIYLLRQDTNNAAGGVCFEDLSKGTVATPANASVWEGAWQASAVSLAYEGAECCVPDVPVLIHQDNTTNSAFYALRAPDCPACGVLAKTVLFGTNTLQEGLIVDYTTYASYGIPVVFYTSSNATVIAVYPTCAIEFTNVAPTVCNSTVPAQ